MPFGPGFDSRRLHHNDPFSQALLDDNDQDGLADALDPGCVGTADFSERDPTLICDVGVDNDPTGTSITSRRAAATPRVSRPRRRSRARAATTTEGSTGTAAALQPPRTRNARPSRGATPRARRADSVSSWLCCCRRSQCCGASAWGLGMNATSLRTVIAPPLSAKDALRERDRDARPWPDLPVVATSIRLRPTPFSGTRHPDP
jgi:hypothetical protein